MKETSVEIVRNFRKSVWTQPIAAFALGVIFMGLLPWFVFTLVLAPTSMLFGGFDSLFPYFCVGPVLLGSSWYFYKRGKFRGVISIAIVQILFYLGMWLLKVKTGHGISYYHSPSEVLKALLSSFADTE